ncbi:hypothetical protein TNCT_554401, partial [Trichonephila clavata]
IAVIRRDNDKSEMQSTEIPFGLYHNGSEITIRRHLQVEDLLIEVQSIEGLHKRYSAHFNRS